MTTNMNDRRRYWRVLTLLTTVAVLCAGQACALSVGALNIEYFIVSGKKAYSLNDCTTLTSRTGAASPWSTSTSRARVPEARKTKNSPNDTTTPSVRPRFRGSTSLCNRWRGPSSSLATSTRRTHRAWPFHCSPSPRGATAMTTAEADWTSSATRAYTEIPDGESGRLRQPSQPVPQRDPSHRTTTWSSWTWTAS